MDAAAWSDVVFWVIGGMVVCTTIAVTGALMAMGRTGYKD